eukprot:755100-Hanusia_phi.AAC.6
MSRRAAGRKSKAIGSDEETEQLLSTERNSFPDSLASFCIVFDRDDDEESGNVKSSMTKKIRQPIIDKLRAADLLVRETVSIARDEVFVLVSASEKRQKQVAEVMGTRGLLKLRLRQQDLDGREETNEGAWTPFKQYLQPFYEYSSEGTLFSSAQQLQILEFIINDEDERAMGPQLIPKENILPGNTALDQLAKNQVIKQCFRLHRERSRDWLEQRWVWQWRRAQPIEAIREYFGTKIALYFVWLGYYTTMLWIPAICGFILFLSNIYSHVVTGSMDNPWVPLYCSFITVWAVVFVSGWKRVEKTYQHEWDTLTFEDEEEDRKEFIQNPYTRERMHDYKNEVVRYPGIRASRCSLEKHSAVPFCSGGMHLHSNCDSSGLSSVGKAIGGCCQATSILVFNKIYQYVLSVLTDFENWQTETQYEDATIAKDFCFKIVNAYFACFFVAFVQNNMLIYGVDMHCPEWHCMPELAGTLAAVFILQLTIAQFMEVGLPIMKNRVRIFLKERAAKSYEVQSDEVENALVMSPEEKESKLDKYSGVFEEYQEMVIQFGYVTLFAAAFPLTAALSLMNNLVEIRTDAYKLLKGVQRPATKVAADIGTWQVILDIISTCCILTNCALVGFTSHGLFFYFPDMTPVERVWITVICEHCLLIFKAVLDAILNDPPKEALEAYERRCYLRDQVLAECQYLQPEESDGPFYTDDEGEPFYGK